MDGVVLWLVGTRCVVGGVWRRVAVEGGGPSLVGVDGHRGLWWHLDDRGVVEVVGVGEGGAGADADAGVAVSAGDVVSELSGCCRCWWQSADLSVHTQRCQSICERSPQYFEVWRLRSQKSFAQSLCWCTIVLCFDRLRCKMRLQPMFWLCHLVALVVGASDTPQILDDMLVAAIRAGLSSEPDLRPAESLLETLEQNEDLTLQSGNLAVWMDSTSDPAATAKRPAMELLWDLYMWAANAANSPDGAEDTVRKLIITSADRGLMCNSNFASGKRPHAGELTGTPLGYLLQAPILDPEFIGAFLRDNSGYDSSGTLLKTTAIPKSVRARRDGVKYGLSLLHLLANTGAEINIVRDFLQAQDARERRGTDVDEVFALTHLDRLFPYSESATALADYMRDGGNPQVYGAHNTSRAFASKIDNELTRSVTASLLKHSLQSGLGPGLNFGELVAVMPPMDLTGSGQWPELRGHTNPVRILL